MTSLLKICLVAWTSLCFCDGKSFKDYLKTREDLIQEEKLMTFGAKLKLEGDEIAANDCLMAAKRKELDEGLKHPSKFLPALNFMEARDQIEQSEVFKIIRRMPKGAVFHAHSTALAPMDFIIKNLTYHKNLYACLENGQIKFHFFEKPSKDCNWQDMNTLRSKSVLNDSILKNKILTLSEGKSTDALDLDHMWTNFEKIFASLAGLLKYRPAFEDYFYESLQGLFDDNIMYIEVRSTSLKLYELDGRQLDTVYAIGVLKNVVDRFTRDHPGFLGAKLIYSVPRAFSNESFDEQVRTFRAVKKAYPDFIVGFDLVGQEDKGHTLLNFAEKLLELGKETQFFFHAGETNWYGQPSDENLVDTVLLNTKRIGHGFALLKHPKLMEMVKAKKITIELNPISNQVLKLVKDMRNHPASYFFAENFPIVVSNDDPSLWGARGLSYDFYEAFVGIMSRRADLRALKQLATNSIVFSSMNAREQKTALDEWGKAWNKFVKYLAKEHKCVAY